MQGREDYMYIHSVPQNVCQTLGRSSLAYFEWNMLYQHKSISQPLRSYLLNLFKLSFCPHHPFRALATFISKLNSTVLNQWIGRGGLHAWPPCSPDLSPLISTCGIHKVLGVSGEITNTRQLLQCIMDGAALIWIMKEYGKQRILF
jgi:hypothetical protein